VKATETAVIAEVRTIRLSLPGVGVPKLRHMLRENASFTHKVSGRNRFYDVLRRLGIVIYFFTPLNTLLRSQLPVDLEN